MSTSPDREQVAALLDRWTAAGIIDGGQAERMRADMVRPDDRTTSTSDRRRAVAVEALAYLGCAVVAGGVALVVAQYWSDLTTIARLAIVGGSCAGLLLAAALVPSGLGGAPARLRAVLLLASTAAASGVLVLLTDDVLGLVGSESFVVVAGGTAAYAAVLWVSNRSPLQQVAMMIAAAIAAASVLRWAGADPDARGLGVWVVGVSWAALGWTHVLRPRRLALALGTATSILGAMTTAGSDLGLVLVVVTVCAAVAVAVIAQDLVVLGVAAVGVVLNVPVAMQRWFAGSMSAALALIVAGLALVGVAVWISRRNEPARRRG